MDGTPQPVFTYAATVVSVYDGDTATLLIDVGFSCFRKEKVRLLRIDAPELTGETRQAGLASRDYLRALIPFGSHLLSPQSVTSRKNTGDIWQRSISLTDEMSAI